MTRRAIDFGMPSRQRKWSFVVIEDRAAPVRCRVAERTVRRKSCRAVIRIRRLLEIVHVTRSAVRG